MQFKIPGRVCRPPVPNLENISEYQTIPEDFQDLHLHFDNFKNSIEKDFKFLKEATSRNVENFQTSLNLQQTY